MKTLSCLLATLLLAVSADAASSAEPIIYVGSIEPLQQAPSGSGPLHHLATRSHNRKVNQNAATLSKDIARALSSQNVPAVVLSTDAPLPIEGWLVRGVYYAIDNLAQHPAPLQRHYDPAGPSGEELGTVAS